MLTSLDNFFCWIIHGYNRKQWTYIQKCKRDRSIAVQAQREYCKNNPDFWRDKNKLKKAWDLLKQREAATNKYAEATGYFQAFPKSQLLINIQNALDETIQG